MSKLELWKSDIEGAFRLLWVHPLWMLRQLVEVEGQLYVDRCVVLGGGTSPRCWCIVAALLAWIVRYRANVAPVFHFVDDYFGVSYDGAATLGAFREAPCDELRIPVADKDDDGREIEIIGLLIDMDTLTITMPGHTIDDILGELKNWLEGPKWRSTKQGRQLAGWIQWTLNVFHSRGLSLTPCITRLRRELEEASA